MHYIGGKYEDGQSFSIWLRYVDFGGNNNVFYLAYNMN
jgi:hypothetical protein